MKTVKELKKLLVSNIQESFENISNVIDIKYYNKYLGDTSILLTSLLQEGLLEKTDWEPSKWLDDSLLTKIITRKKYICIWGIAIWGKAGTLEQWTDPLYFEGEINKTEVDFNQYTFLFGDLDNLEISYTDFLQNRDVWDKKYYKNAEWDPHERNWRYTINS